MSEANGKLDNIVVVNIQAQKCTGTTGSNFILTFQFHEKVKFLMQVV